MHSGRLQREPKAGTGRRGAGKHGLRVRLDPETAETGGREDTSPDPQNTRVADWVLLTVRT